jgi:[acyl-carrier-protein] S-malonyltransferase
VEQITAPVRWEESMRALISQGFSRFIELGPGKALSGVMKRIDKNVSVFGVGDVASLQETTNALSER